MSSEILDVGTPRGVIPEPLTEEEHEEHEHEAPIGTLFFMMVFLFLMVALWGTAYWMLLKR